LPGIEVFGGAVILQFFVVGPYDERVFRPFQLVPPFLQRHLHCEKLTISHIVVFLNGVEAMGEEGTGM
jgi:hypothetical protein